MAKGRVEGIKVLSISATSQAKVAARNACRACSFFILPSISQRTIKPPNIIQTRKLAKNAISQLPLSSRRISFMNNYAGAGIGCIGPDKTLAFRGRVGPVEKLLRNGGGQVYTTVGMHPAEIVVPVGSV